MKDKIYRSDIGKGTLLILMLAAGFVGMLFVFLVPEYAWVGMLSLGVILGYLAFVYAKTSYHLTPENQLKITFGFKRKEIDIFQISSLRPFTEYNMPNAYTFSENRIRVVYGYGDYVDISPQHPDQFIHALLDINPLIQHHRA
ncbi:MAG: PH domain-containing protein [Cyclobacteriaceae bacterium]